nr:MAG TPA: hypothetical protein [Bacteriophage sp.]
MWCPYFIITRHYFQYFCEKVQKSYEKLLT